jgi:hypothetical protein
MGPCTRILALAVVVTLLTTSLAFAQNQPTLELLACERVVPDPDQHAVVQFERETFPPLTDTGLFLAQGQQLLYVEQGLLTVFDEQIGKGIAQTGDSYLAAPNGPIGVRNDEYEDASLLWVRLAEPSVVAAPLGYLSPAALRAVLTQIDGEAPGLQPLFIEFALPDSVFGEDTLLFLMRIEIAPFSAVNVGGETSRLTTSGRFAIVIENGSLQVDDDAPRAVFSGEWTALNGDQSYTIENLDAEPARGFMVGIVDMTDEGALRAQMLDDQSCHA